MVNFEELATLTKTKIEGPITWRQFHSISKNFTAEDWKETYDKHTVAMHDAVNWKLDKPIKDLGNLQAVAGEYEDAMAGLPPGQPLGPIDDREFEISHRQMHAACQNLSCATCRVMCDKFTKGIDDMISWKRGEPIQDPENLTFVGAIYRKAAEGLPFPKEDMVPKPFNIQNPNNNQMALSKSDIGVLVGADFGAKGIEVGIGMVDEALKLETKTAAERPSTWIKPIAGVALVLAAAFVKKVASKPTVQLAVAALGSHMLAETVDTVQEVMGLAASGLTIISPARVISPPGVRVTNGGLAMF